MTDHGLPCIVKRTTVLDVFKLIMVTDHVCSTITRDHGLPWSLARPWSLAIVDHGQFDVCQKPWCQLTKHGQSWFSMVV